MRKYQDIKFPPSGKSPTKAVVESMSKLNIAMEHPAPAPQVGTTVPVPEPMKVEEKKLEPKLTLEELAKRIKSGAYKKIVALTGAGISVNAGIPDFRSPGTGLYNQLEKLNLPFPEAVFTLEYFKENPEPFFQVAKEMFGKKYVPTKAHYFLRLLEQKGLLIRNYTQNIDNLEADAGMAADKLIQAHGTYASAHCVGCKMAVDGKAMVESIREGKPKYCEKCKSPCKPDIVFFGESLPDRFFDKVAEVKHDCDFLMIMGSTLQVMPFNMLPLMVGPEVPRLVINNELPELFAEDARNGDVYMAGDSDASITKLVALLGWNEELAKLMAERAELAKKYGVELKS